MSSMAAPDTRLVVNGTACKLPGGPRTTLLTALRNDLGLNGPKYGCGLGACGACTVLVDGVAARACTIPLAGVAGRSVTTLEGLADGGRLHPVQQAFIDAQAAQCGYCLNGMLMMAVALLEDTPRPTEGQVRQALSGNLCRCGTHIEIVQAVLRAAELLAADRPAPGVPADAAHPAR
jgi:nicotinate dehydrogenase subunit A